MKLTLQSLYFKFKFKNLINPDDNNADFENLKKIIKLKKNGILFINHNKMAFTGCPNHICKIKLNCTTLMDRLYELEIPMRTTKIGKAQAVVTFGYQKLPLKAINVNSLCKLINMKPSNSLVYSITGETFNNTKHKKTIACTCIDNPKSKITYKIRTKIKNYIRLQNNFIISQAQTLVMINLNSLNFIRVFKD